MQQVSEGGYQCHSRFLVCSPSAQLPKFWHGSPYLLMVTFSCDIACIQLMKKLTLVALVGMKPTYSLEHLTPPPRPESSRRLEQWIDHVGVQVWMSLLPTLLASIVRILELYTSKWLQVWAETQNVYSRVCLARGSDIKRVHVHTSSEHKLHVQASSKRKQCVAIVSKALGLCLVKYVPWITGRGGKPHLPISLSILTANKCDYGVSDVSPCIYMYMQHKHGVCMHTFM